MKKKKKDIVIKDGFAQYLWTTVTSMAPYVEGFNMNGVSISKEDIETGSPKKGDMIGRNSNKEMWLVSEKCFKSNFTPMQSESETLAGNSVEVNLLKFIQDTINSSGTWGAGPSRSRYYEPQYDLLIGIGNDHTAVLRIGKSALGALGKFGDVSNLLK